MSIKSNHLLFGNQWHPKFKPVLVRANGASYAIPSFQCLKLQDKLFRNLDKDGILSRLDALYIYANDSVNIDMSRINYVQPTKSLSTNGTTTPVHVVKKGIYGSMDCVGFHMDTDRVAMSSATQVSCFVWLTESGTTLPGVENLLAINGANGQNERIRVRPSANRADYLLNSTTAGAAVIYTGFPLDNHFYHIDMGNYSGDVHHTNYVNGVLTKDVFPSASGALPSGSFLQMIDVASQRQVGIVGVGASISAVGKSTEMYNHFKTYMDGLALLP